MVAVVVRVVVVVVVVVVVEVVVVVAVVVRVFVVIVVVVVRSKAGTKFKSNNNCTEISHRLALLAVVQHTQCIFTAQRSTDHSVVCV